VNEATQIILLHQLLFQGMFFTKNLLLRIKLRKPIRGHNREARLAVAFFVFFIVIALYLAWTGFGFGALRILPERGSTGLCLLLLGCNMGVAALSLKDLGDSWRVGVIQEQQTELIENGIYSVTRNPYFLAYLLMFAAYTLLLQNLVLLALSFIGFFMVHAMILKEEAYLESVHGQAYRDYKRRVSRYLVV
jgi:protein-S-isoprenylcysteine O-methyltransferase Ste14